MSKEMREQINKVKNWKQFLNENKETIPTENNPWQDYVEKFNARWVPKHHSYEYIKYAASEVLYEFTIGLKKFLEEKGITVLDNKDEPYPELTASFYYYQDLDKYKNDKEKSLMVSWKNDDEILTTIIDYFLQHKDKVVRSNDFPGRYSTTIFFRDRRDIP